MNKGIKWLLGAVIGIVLLLVVAVVVALVVIDPNAYKGQIANAVEQRTGEPLVIEGDIHLTFFPWLGVTVEKAHMPNPPGFGQQPIMAVRKLGVSVKLLPLFGGRIEADTLILDGLRLNLVKNRQGKANWEVIQQKAASGSRGGEQAPKPTGQGGVGEKDDKPAAALALGGVELTDAVITYQDMASGERTVVGPVNLHIGELQAGKPVSVKGDAKAELPGSVNATLDLDSTVRASSDHSEIDVMLDKLGVLLKGKGMPADGIPVALSGKIGVKTNQGTLDSQDLKLDVAGATANIALQGTGLNTDPTIKTRLVLQETNPGKLASNLGVTLPKMRGPDALSKLAAQIQAVYHANSVKIPDIQVVLDKSTLTGTASLPRLSPPAIRFDLAVDQLDVDRYMPPKSEGGGGGGTPAEAAGAGAAKLPTDVVRGLDVDGRLRIGHLATMGAKLESVSATVKAKNGVLKVEPMTAQLYKGQYQGSMTLDARKDTPALSMTEGLKGVQLQPLLRDVVGKDLIQGTANLNLNADTRGQTTDELIKALTGKADFHFADGAVLGFNLAQAIRQAEASLTGGKAAKDQAAQKTDFTEMKGELKIKGSELTNPSFSASSPLFRVNGDGSMNWVEQTVKYNLTVNVVGTLTGQGGKSLDQLKAVPIPLNITGKVSDPKIGLDLARALTDSQKAKLKRKAQKELEKGRGDLKKGFLKELDKLNKKSEDNK